MASSRLAAGAQARRVRREPLPGLLSRLGHELRTPLNAIIGFSDLMRSGAFGALGSERYAEYVGLIHDSARYLLTTIDSLQTLSGLEQGHAALRHLDSDLGAIAHAALENASAAAVAKSIVLRLDAAGPRIVVRVDPERIHDILLQLANNSIQFTPDQGRVTMKVGRDSQGRPFVRVSDTGVGIATADRANVFEPFVQLKPAGVKSHDGPGLGLTTARAIADLHDAKLAVDANPGGGTRVLLTLPKSAIIAVRRLSPKHDPHAPDHPLRRRARRRGDPAQPPRL